MNIVKFFSDVVQLTVKDRKLLRRCASPNGVFDAPLLLIAFIPPLAL